jgi:hypothetical protein
VLIRPEELSVVPGDGAHIDRIDFHGHDTVYVLSTDDGLALRARVNGAPRFLVGDRVGLAFSGAVTVSFPPDREN